MIGQPLDLNRLQMEANMPIGRIYIEVTALSNPDDPKSHVPVGYIEVIPLSLWNSARERSGIMFLNPVGIPAPLRAALEAEVDSSCDCPMNVSLAEELRQRWPEGWPELEPALVQLIGMLMRRQPESLAAALG
ncbi:hypothetical protein ACMHYB_06725 [Sorangium sp. So ce1128]